MTGNVLIFLHSVSNVCFKDFNSLVRVVSNGNKDKPIFVSYLIKDTRYKF